MPLCLQCKSEEEPVDGMDDLTARLLENEVCEKCGDRCEAVDTSQTIKAQELVGEVEQKLSKAARAGVVDPDLPHKLSMAKQAIGKTTSTLIVCSQNEVSE